MRRVLFSAVAAMLIAGTVPGAAQIHSRAVCGAAQPGAARCHARIVTDSGGRALATLQAPARGLTPADLRDAYGASANGHADTVIAVVAAYGYDDAEADLNTYRAYFGLRPCTAKSGCFRKFNQRGEQKNYPAQNLDWAQDSAIDLEMASALCPNCSLYLIEGDVNSFASLGVAENLAASLGAHVIVNSYGGDEPNSQQFEPAYTHPGIAVVASSGDRGNIVQFPGSSSHVIAVGGTRLSRDGSARGWSETAWADGGSGCSAVYAKPRWQTDKGCAMRTVADVAAEADPTTGVAVYAPLAGGGSGWLEFGGTSVAAPIVGGIYGANGGRVHEGRDPYRHKDALFDITEGRDGVCKPHYLCVAKPGYDGPTGNGTPNGASAFGARTPNR